LANAALVFGDAGGHHPARDGGATRTNGIYEHVCAACLPQLKDLLASFLAQVGKLLVCTPCVQQRHIEQAMLIDGAELIAGARVILDATSSSAVLNY